MDCRQFRSKHVAYVDDLLPAVEMAEMLGHVNVCDRCARQDTAIRRSLMIVRSLPSIEPSPDFMARLTERLQTMPASHEYDGVRTANSFLPPLGAIAALAAGVAAVAYMALQTSRYYAPDGPAIEPAIAASTIPMAAPMANAAFMASVPTAMPVWPAVLMVGQAPMRFASATLENTTETR
jgi:hypothetical protein